jgi:hypothetical protein
VVKDTAAKSKRLGIACYGAGGVRGQEKESAAETPRLGLARQRFAGQKFILFKEFCPCYFVGYKCGETVNISLQRLHTILIVFNF